MYSIHIIIIINILNVDGNNIQNYTLLREYCELYILNSVNYILWEYFDYTYMILLSIIL